MSVKFRFSGWRASLDSLLHKRLLPFICCSINRERLLTVFFATAHIISLAHPPNYLLNQRSLFLNLILYLLSRVLSIARQTVFCNLLDSLHSIFNLHKHKVQNFYSIWWIIMSHTLANCTKVVLHSFVKLLKSINCYK